LKIFKIGVFAGCRGSIMEDFGAAGTVVNMVVLNVLVDRGEVVMVHHSGITLQQNWCVVNRKISGKDVGDRAWLRKRHIRPRYLYGLG
jgi:hypothetical protein